MSDEHLWDSFARDALHAYGLEPSQLIRVGGASNTNLRVAHDGQSSLLRLHTHSTFDAETIVGELRWLEQLREATALPLQAPRRNLAGHFVTKVTMPGKRDLLCTLLSWLPGSIPPTAAALSDAQLRMVGATMAQLHHCARVLGPPRDIRRPTYDGTYFRARLAALITAVRQTDLPDTAVVHIDAGVQALIDRVDGLGRDRASFGLIHADFHSGNYVLDDAAVQLIDFDRCGFGFFLHDLALALMELEEAQRPPLLEGYQQIAPLPSGHPTLTDTFICLAFVDTLGFHASNPAELPFILDEVPLLRDALEHASR